MAYKRVDQAAAALSMRYVLASAILAVLDVLANLNTWLKANRPESVSRKPSQDASRPWVMIDVTSSTRGVPSGHTREVRLSPRTVCCPRIVHSAASVSHAVIASASPAAQSVTNSPTMVILGAFPQSAGRTVFMSIAGSGSLSRWASTGQCLRQIQAWNAALPVWICPRASPRS